MTILAECDVGGMEMLSSPQAKRFVWLKFKADFLWHGSFPLTSYPIEVSCLDNLLARGGLISIEDIIRGLMCWMDVVNDPQPSCEILRQILRHHYPPSPEMHAGCEFQDEHQTRYRLRLGPIAAKTPIVAWQRGPWVAAIGCPSKIEPERLKIAAPRPITMNTAKSILSHSRVLDDAKASNCYMSALAATGVLITAES